MDIKARCRQNGNNDNKFLAFTEPCDWLIKLVWCGLANQNQDIVFSANQLRKLIIVWLWVGGSCEISRVLAIYLYFGSGSFSAFSRSNPKENLGIWLLHLAETKEAEKARTNPCFTDVLQVYHRLTYKTVPILIGSLLVQIANSIHTCTRSSDFFLPFCRRQKDTHLEERVLEYITAFVYWGSSLWEERESFLPTVIQVVRDVVKLNYLSFLTQFLCQTLDALRKPDLIRHEEIILWIASAVLLQNLQLWKPSFDLRH